MSLSEDLISCIRKFICKLDGTADDHNYAPNLHSLFGTARHDNDQNVVNLVWSLLEEIRHVLECSGVFPMKIKQWMDDVRPTRDKDVQTDHSHEMVDQRFVQVTCDKVEVERRIVAFMKRKRAESDAFNRREFCRISEDKNLLNSCARTDAIFVPRQSKKSLVKIHKVTNDIQRKEKCTVENQNLRSWHPSHPSSTLPYYKLPFDLRERLDNLSYVLSSHQKISDERDIYTHIKELEEKVLYLETLSPEYFNIYKQNPIKEGGHLKESSLNATTKKVEQAVDGENTALIDLRIEELREKLRQQAGELRQKTAIKF